MGHPASFAATENHTVNFTGQDCFAGFADPDSSQFANVSGNYLNNGSTFYKTFVRTVRFAEGLGDGIEEMGAVVRSYIDDPDKLFESGETLANTALTLTTLLFEGPVATAAGIALLVEMAVLMWNSPELIHYSDNKEEVAYDSGKVIGGMLLVAAIFKGAQNAINALKSDIHVQYMVNGAKLQIQGILSKSDTLAALAGKINSILKCVEGSFTAEAMAYLEQYLTAEKGSRFLEAVRKLERELGDKMPQLDTAKAKRIVESLDDGKSVDDVVAELKSLCESGNALWDMPEGGAFINGREYSQHALERMAPDTPQVRAELSKRAKIQAAKQGYKIGTKEYHEFCRKYVSPRNIPPSVVEDAIQSTTAIPGKAIDTFVHETAELKVIVNSTGRVITVYPK